MTATNPSDAWGTVPRMLRAQAEAAPDAVVIVDRDITLTTAELRERAARLGRALIASGVEPGDRVALWAPNTWEWAVAAFATWEVGGVLVPLSTRFKAYEAGDMLARMGVTTLVAAEGFLGTSYVGMLAEKFGPSADVPFKGLPSLRTVVVLGPTDIPGVRSMSDFLTLADEVSPVALEERALSVPPDAYLDILSTSGTTGAPKGVMLDHAQILRAYWDWSEIADLRRGDHYPVVSPLAHGFGIHAGLLACVMRLAVMIPIQVFDPDRALELVDAQKVNFMAGPPTLFSRLLANPTLAEHDISSLRVAIVGAASVPEELVSKMLTRLGIARVVNAYGLIEGTVVSMTRAGDPVGVVASTAGSAVPGMEIRIVDPEGGSVPAGVRGEIQLRGYGVMRGYWDAPETTAQTLVDGWLRTGDVGVLDAAGNLSIVGRLKEMFIVGGFNTYPAEVENLLLRHPDVAQVAVVPIPHDELGEVGCAFVVPQAGRDVAPAELVAWARSNMSNYKVPRSVVIVPNLPTNVNGKVDRTHLRQAALDTLP